MCANSPTLIPNVLADDNWRSFLDSLPVQADLVDLFCHLAAVDAPSGHERVMADLVSSYLTDLQLTVVEDGTGAATGGNAGNLLCRIPASGCLDPAPLLFSTHLDTVQPCLGKQIQISPAGVIHTDGQTVLGADDLAGVTAVLAAVMAICRAGLSHRGLELLFSVSEEKHLQGIKHFAADGLTARQGYVLDTSGAPGLAVVAAPGHILLDCTVFGQAAHAGIAPETGVSAITAAARGIAAMHLGRISAATTANIGSVRGGGETNIVADTCRITAECRSLDASALREQADHMRSCLQNAVEEVGATVSIREEQSYLPYSVPSDAPVVQRFLTACRRLGLPGELTSTGGGSDLNILARSGLQGIVLSTGMTCVHSGQESLMITDLVNLTKLVLLLMTDPDEYGKD